MSWAHDDRLYVSCCDGYGGPEASKDGLYNSRLLAARGDPRELSFEEFPGYPAPMSSITASAPRYYSFGTLALDRHIYQFLSTWNVPANDMKNLRPNELRFIGAKLIYSSDGGRVWRNQDGSTPVVWESWENRTRDSMAFFNEDQETFSLLSILQMGKNYEHNKDGYIYVYAPNGNTEGTMNELVMFRVRRAGLLNRDAYEFFSGRGLGGSARWSSNISDRAVVHSFPRGWVNRLVHPFAWQPSVTYNAGLGVYIMASWGTGTDRNGLWFGGPSYLGLWVAPHPWGAWTQIHEEVAWCPGGDRGARAFAPQISPKWISADGKSFWLVWSDYQIIRKAEWDIFVRGTLEKERRHQMTSADWAQRLAMLRRHMPYYSFNAQRIDVALE